MDGLVDGHSDQYRPLGGYALLIGAFNGAVAAALVAAGRHGRLPEQYAVGDLVLAGVATYKLSRTIAMQMLHAAAMEKT